MSKNSAYSKGYRKTQAKKPFLTKNEIIALIVIAVVVIIGVIVINSLPNVGTIPASKIKSGDIISRANVSTKGRYIKLGTINEMEGITLEASTSSENPTGGYDFKPVEEGALKNVRVGGAIYNASTMMDTLLPSVQTMGADDYSEEAIATTIDGREAYVCTARYSSYDETKDGAVAADETAEAAEGAEQEPNSFNQYIFSYITVGDYSISLSATIEGDDTSVYIPDDQVADYIAQYAGAFTVNEK